MSPLKNVLVAATEVEEFCSSCGWHFCFIGGVAVQRWGGPRFTQDVDLTLLTGFGAEQQFVDALLRRFSGRGTDAREFALQYRVVLARTNNDIDLDIALGAFPFEERTVERATPWMWGGEIPLTTCSAEDLIIHKAFAGRDRDWADVESVLNREHGKLDFDLIRVELPPLLEIKETRGSFEKLEHMISLVEKRLAR